MKNIAIMGARGFVGKSLVNYWTNDFSKTEKYKVFPVTRDNFSLLDYKAVKNFLKENKIDIVIHCANEGGSRKTQDKTDVVKDNLQMFFNLEECITPEMKMINFGSGAQYNKFRDLKKIKESEIGQVLPEDDYGYSKYLMHKYIEKGATKNIYNPIIFGLFGKYEDYSFRFISNSILKNILKMPIVINQNVIFDFLYINDFLKIIETILETDVQYKEFNITPNESIDLIKIVEIINEIGNYKSEIIVKNSGLNYQYTGDNSRLLKNIGEYRFFSYEESIKDLYEYYLKNIDKIDLEVIKKDEYLNNCKTK